MRSTRSWSSGTTQRKPCHKLRPVFRHVQNELAPFWILGKNQHVNEQMGCRCEFPEADSIQDLLHRQAKATPDKLAVASYASLSSHASELTYKQLWELASRIKRQLNSIGVGATDRVATCLHRGVHMIAGIMGVLATDAAYVPVDPAYPYERIEYMCEDTEAKLLLTELKIQPIVSELQVQMMVLDDPMVQDALIKHSPEIVPSQCTQHDVVYVVYTSGSTGKPKGILVEQHGLINLTQWHQQEYQVW